MLIAIDEQAEARVRLAARATAQLAGLQIDEHAPIIMERKFARCLFAPDQYIVLLPSVLCSSIDRTIARAVGRQTRSNVLMVACGHTAPGKIETRYVIVPLSDEQPSRPGYRLWTDDPRRALHLVGEGDSEPSFQFGRTGLCIEAQPCWKNARAYDDGIRAAELILAAAIRRIKGNPG
jgi:hypothetical protein